MDYAIAFPGYPQFPSLCMDIIKGIIKKDFVDILINTQTLNELIIFPMNQLSSTPLIAKVNAMGTCDGNWRWKLSH